MVAQVRCCDASQEASVRRRVLPIVGLFCLAVAVTLGQRSSLAQDLYVTNLQQLAAEAYDGDHCFYFPGPMPPW